MTNAARSSTATMSDLVQSYRAHGPLLNDEMVDASGALRAHWSMLVDGLNQFNHEERSARAVRLDRRVRETGIAYDVFADPNTRAQRWSLDLMPLVFSEIEWRTLEAAMVQRARLFDAILTDLYGAQTLMQQGLVPAELVFADKAFLRPCQNILPRAGHLQFYAADLARGADGKWRVIDNHTETLAGAGFAIANRMALTHIAGDLFNRCNAIRLAPHFQRMQAALTAHAGRENARIALLTPGPHHEDYFSHTLLARYLGYLLVEGSDLRTRGNQVYLKTLEGLKVIDLVVRCVDGSLVDPLELDPSGFSGPAGLLRVCRDHPRLVVNAIGSAIVQNRGLGAYLPRLARAILGEELMVADAPRWWLGDIEAREHVLQNLDHLLIRQAQEGTGRPGQAALGQDARSMPLSDRDRLQRNVVLHGASLVAEEKIDFSTAPTFGATGLVPKPFAMRMYVAMTKDGYKAMPGGLAMTVNPDRAVALSAPDGQTRDVWVVSADEQAPHTSLWRPTLETARVDRSQRVIQSRVADDLFWLGRYSERADWTMRVLRSALRRTQEDSGPPTGRRAARKCLEALIGKDVAAAGVSPDTTRGVDIEKLCAHLITRGKGTRTLDRTFDGLYRVSFLVRDRLSLEAWRTLSRFRPGTLG